MKSVRCAIYTRKSSDEGLEQGFNSLDAQREACEAYIKSQASEGWVALPDFYDDGGISGGTLERPALQRLLADVGDRKVDIIVVYKVDRLSRSLFDFAKLVELFEKTDTSFVSITQPISTTSSMGRLTLNMLLSFAQFEREVTAERIRDKIAASKAKGMWMGGVPPIGYHPNGRSLAIIPEHTELIRHIFRRYLEVAHVNALADELERQGRFTPKRVTLGKGTPLGGVPFARGQLYKILKCETYVGEVHHKEHVYPGLHQAIIDRDLWDRVQAKLADHTQGPGKWQREGKASLLAGRIVDGQDQPLIAAHSVKTVGATKRRYSYYVSRALHHGESDGGIRVPAREIDGVVTQRLAEAFDDPLTLLNQANLEIPADSFTTVIANAALIAARVRNREVDLVRRLITKVRVLPAVIQIDCNRGVIADQLDAELCDEAATLTLTAAVRLTRSGMAVRLIQGGQAVTAEPEKALIRLLGQARHYWLELRKGELDITRLAAREKVTTSWMTRVLRLAFLPPALTDEILAGRQPIELTAGSLLRTDAIEPVWAHQLAAFQAGSMRSTSTISLPT